MALKEIQVPWDPKNKWAKPALMYREQLKQYEIFDKMSGSLRDVCVFYFDTGKWEAAMAFSSCVKGVKTVKSYHAEQVLINGYKTGFGKVTAVYTELQSCGTGTGMRNCRHHLEKFLETYGAQKGATPVYYSYPYPSADKTTRKASTKSMSKGMDAQGF